jgi:serine protease Do
MDTHGRADWGKVVERLRRATVRIGDGPRGEGSGVVWSLPGTTTPARIVTNAHVARHDAVTVQLWDGCEMPGRVAARNSSRDLALIEIIASPGADPWPESTPALSWTTTAALRPGETLLAVGNPLGFTGALSTGVLHSVGTVPGLGAAKWVQADVRLAPGNSGGPLADARGRLIGINTMIAAGLALAVPSDAVVRFLNGNQAPLGVIVRPVPVAGGDSGAWGLLLLEVEPNSPAAEASLLPGDVLVGVDGAPLHSLDDFSESLAGAAGLRRIQFWRGSPTRQREVAVRLGSRPRGSPAVAA